MPSTADSLPRSMSWNKAHTAWPHHEEIFPDSVLGDYQDDAVRGQKRDKKQGKSVGKRSQNSIVVKKKAGLKSKANKLAWNDALQTWSKPDGSRPSAVQTADHWRAGQCRRAISSKAQCIRADRKLCHIRSKATHLPWHSFGLINLFSMVSLPCRYTHPS